MCIARSFAAAEEKRYSAALLFVGAISNRPPVNATFKYTVLCRQTKLYTGKENHQPSAESLFGPLFAILIGFEVFRLNIVIGGVIILAGVVLSEIEFKRRRKTL